MAADVTQYVAKGKSRATGLYTLSFGVFHGDVKQSRDQQSRQSHHKEGHLPGFDYPDQGKHLFAPLLDHRDSGTANDESEATPQERAAGVDAQRQAQFRFGEGIGNHGIGRWRQRGLAHTDCHTGHEQLEKVLGGTAGRGGKAPDSDAHRYDEGPGTAVRESGDGYASDSIQHGKCQTVQQAELGIRDLQVGANGLYQQGDNLAVDKRKDIGQHAQGDDVPGISQ